MFSAALFTIAKPCKRPRCPANDQDAPLPKNGLRKCSIYMQWKFTRPQKNEIYLFAGKMDGIVEHHLK
jgi:hypothetical protein